MKRKTKLFMTALILIMGALFMTGCQKDKEIDQPFEMVTQTFTIFDTYDINTKSWDYNQWFSTDQYNQTPTLFKLTGVGANAGYNYETLTTIQDLRDGNVTFEMRKGQYQITFETPHIRSTNQWFLNGSPLISEIDAPQLAEKIDIKIDQTIIIDVENPTGT